MPARALGTGLMLAALLAFPGALTAQFAVGGGAGLTFTNLGGDDVDDEDLDSKTGFYVGASVGIPLGGILGLGTGAFYVEKGAEEPGDGDGVLDLAYLEIPVLLQAQVTGSERPVAIVLFAGPSLGFNLSCDFEEGGASADCGDDVTSFDLGALFGAGVGLPLGESATLAVNGGLDLGLTSIELFDEDADVKNEAYFIGIDVSWLVGG